MQPLLKISNGFYTTRCSTELPGVRSSTRNNVSTRALLELPQRNSDKQPVLVFYASSTVAYSKAFLKDLSKFGKAICVITEQPFDHIPLKFSALSQTIEDVVKWIQEKVQKK